ncbi:uncharacterized protein B0J16DRAFT_188248 [Fusarium flagelliforme]|uniref:Proteoglycan n=1 Tax=Fusarium flagelliforme TaxID=2675880 RepID=A0A395N1X1_9HYPO|nr:uncharacterized protein B0J16DRAFT_188248 [Fusarium flagelliforme]KAH7173234.1 hypothetical protein B0J16DRAFT_188248 [Fusarium flagelliforme]RFN53975.1 hypothetical protein FIE12Z_1722 [Fusarium flagelliforme]
MKLSKRLEAYWVLNLSLIPSVLAAATCSELSGRRYIGPDGKNFEIQCDTSAVNGAIFAYYSEGDEFQDCVDRCDADSNCIVALFLRGSGDCALISTYQGTRSFSGNDLAIVRPPIVPVTTSAESTSAEATTTETTSSETTTATSSEAEVSSTDSSTAEFSTVVSSSVETTSADTTSTDAISTEAPSTESSAAESSPVAPSLSDATSAESALTESSTIDASTSQSSTDAPSSTESASTQSTTVEPSSTSPESALVTTTDSSYTSIATIETSTEDCEDETSTYETPIAVIDSTSTGSDIQSTTLSVHSESSATTVPQSSELFTSPSSADSTTSSPSSSTTTGTEATAPASVTSQEASSLPVSSTTTVAQTHTTDSLVNSLPGTSCSETQEHGSMTLSTSGVTIMKTTTADRLPTYLPASDCVWTVYLTMVKYVTCSTGVVPETSTTATYVTVDGNAGTRGPPVVQLPEGCIGGYQVDASGNSYPVVQPTVGSQGNPSGEKSHPSVRPTLASPGGSQPSYENGQYHIPAPTAGSQGTSLPEQGNEEPFVQPTQGSQGNASGSKSQPPVSGQDSPEPNSGEPHGTQGEATPIAISAYRSGTPPYSSLSSPIHQGQHNVSMTFTVKTATTGEVQGQSVSSSSPTEAPSTPVIASGSIRHQSMLWTSIAGALFALSMLSV